MAFFGKPDPFQPGAYVHTSTVLYEVVGREGDLVELENVLNGWRHSRPVGDLARASIGGKPNFTVIKRAPEVPDCP